MRSYSIVFRDRDMSEMPFIWAVRRASGLPGHVRTLTADDVWAALDAVIQAQGQPLLGQDLIAQYHAYGLAHAHGAVVVLDGQGSDELLAGMPSYAAVFHQELLRRGQLGQFMLELARDSQRRGLTWQQRLGIAARSLAVALRGRARRPARPVWLHGSQSLARQATDDWQPSRHPSRLNRHLHELVGRTNLQAVLQAQDRSAMIHGIESRVPFLDHHVVEFCSALPPSYKVQDGVRKRVLVEAARGLVPDAVLARRDKKTLVSKANWMPMRSRYGAALREMSEAPAMRGGPWFAPGAVSAFVHAYLEGHHDDASAVWRLYTAWRWIETFQVVE